MKARIICFLLMCATAIITSFAVTAAPSPQFNPAAPATVSFSFDGMEALFFGDPSRVSVGILNVHHHTPQLTVTKVSAKGRTILATWKGNELRGTTFIDVEGRTTGVSRHQAQSIADDKHDLRWAISLTELYQCRFTILEDKLFGKVHFSSGIFYADKLSEMPARFFAADNSGKTLPFNRKIAEPAAKLNLNAGESLLIRGNGAPLRLVAANGVRYEVAITNLPPEDMMSMDHFLHYYEIIGEPLQKFVPVMAINTGLRPFPTACGPIDIDESLSTP